MARIHSSLRSVLGQAVDGQMPWPLTLMGGVGAGKTCAALALADFVPMSAYMTFKELHQHVLACDRGVVSWHDAGNSGTMTTSMFWQSMARKHLVVIDELGMRDHVSDFVYECLFTMIETRVGSPTIYISNLLPDELRNVFDDRILSRLSAGTMLAVSGPDQRRPR